VLHAALLLAVLPGCADEGTPPRRYLPSQSIEEKIQVRLPDGTSVTAEVADQIRERTIGLMGRERVPEGTGMLFIFEGPGHYPFHMQNTLVPLDILWLEAAEEGGRVVHLESRVPPCKRDPCPRYTPMRAALYVLELRGGAAATHTLREGSLVRFQLP
jgi:uncharacterized membrane protein (UPF0127 family)